MALHAACRGGATPAALAELIHAYVPAHMRCAARIAFATCSSSTNTPRLPSSSCRGASVPITSDGERWLRAWPPASNDHRPRNRPKRPRPHAFARASPLSPWPPKLRTPRAPGRAVLAGTLLAHRSFADDAIAIEAACLLCAPPRPAAAPPAASVPPPPPLPQSTRGDACPFWPSSPPPPSPLQLEAISAVLRVAAAGNASPLWRLDAGLLARVCASPAAEAAAAATASEAAQNRSGAAGRPLWRDYCAHLEARLCALLAPPAPAKRRAAGDDCGVIGDDVVSDQLDGWRELCRRWRELLQVAGGEGAVLGAAISQELRRQVSTRDQAEQAILRFLSRYIPDSPFES